MPPAPLFEVVLFDCDSTLCAIEGIDELAARAGKLEEIAQLTRDAMEGRARLEDVYRRRLEIVRPDRAAIAWLGRRYAASLVAGAPEVVSTLTRLGKAVHIASGGIRQAVLPVGKILGVLPERVHAVELSFDKRGGYRGFDRASPLWRADGKAALCRRIVPPDQAAALVGDGATDLAARAAGVFVVGFGGVGRREAVVQGADAYVEGPSLLGVLAHLLTEAEMSRR
jgi:phosphoserine phosphatase